MIYFKSNFTIADPIWQAGNGRGVPHRALYHGDQRHWHRHGRNRMGPLFVNGVYFDLARAEPFDGTAALGQ